MKYKKYELGNYDIHTIVTDRFKTVGFAVQLRIPNEKIHDKYFSMLWRMLVNTSSKYNSIKEINKASANIYDPYYNVRFISSGLQDILVLSGSFINEKYTEIGMNEESIKFLLDVIFNPKIVDDGFDKEIFEIQKSKLIDYYKSTKDYPNEYADMRLHENMQYYDYKEHSLEEMIKLIEGLTNTELYEFYKKVINEGKLDIFVCGNFDADEMRNILKKNVEFKGKKQENPVHQIIQKKYNKKPNVIIENSDNVQSILLIGFKTINVLDYESKYVSLIYSWILGGGFNSLLNQTIREKNSLCYYIYIDRNDLVSGFRICAGINGKDFDKVYALIQEELKNMEQGNFSDELIESVKTTYYHTLENIEDYQSDMLNSFISEVCIGADDIKTRKEKIKNLTKEDIMEYAKKVHIDTVYLLKGDKSE